MANTKLIAALSVFVMIAASFIVLVGADNSSAAGIKTFDINVTEEREELNNGNYWVHVDIDENNSFSLENTSNPENKEKCILYCGSDENYISIMDNFVIPEGCSLIDGYVTAEKKITVKGSYGALADPTRALDSNWSLTLNEDAFVEVDGGYFSPVYLYLTPGSYVKVTNSGDVGLMTMCIKPVKMEAANNMAACEVASAFNSSASSDGPFLNVYNVTTKSDDKTGFEFDVDENSVTAKGTFVGISSDSYMSFLSSGFEIKLVNTDYYNLLIGLNISNAYGTIVISEDDHVFNMLDHNVMFLTKGSISPSYYLENKIKSGNGNLAVAVQCGIVSGHEEQRLYASDSTNSNASINYIPGDIYAAYFDEKGLVERYSYMKFFATEGIESIKTNSQLEIGDTNLFVTAGVAYDLTTVDVKCKSGYSFDGFYYLDDNGKEVKVIDPAHFIAYDNMQIYAKATADQPSYNAYFIAIIAILVIVAILGFAYMILKDRGVIGGYY